MCTSNTDAKAGPGVMAVPQQKKEETESSRIPEVKQKEKELTVSVSYANAHGQGHDRGGEACVRAAVPASAPPGTTLCQDLAASPLRSSSFDLRTLFHP